MDRFHFEQIELNVDPRKNKVSAVCNITVTHHTLTLLHVGLLLGQRRVYWEANKHKTAI